MPGKLVEAIHEARDQARRTLQDPSGVEAELEAATASAQASPELARALAPLVALVRDHAAGRHACDVEDVEWALAAAIYVNAQWDLVPDYLARGLHDDEQVVQWVGQRIFKTLVEHQERHRTFRQAPLTAPPESG